MNNKMSAPSRSGKFQSRKERSRYRWSKTPADTQLNKKYLNLIMKQSSDVIKLSTSSHTAKHVITDASVATLDQRLVRDVSNWIDTVCHDDSEIPIIRHVVSV